MTSLFTITALATICFAQLIFITEAKDCTNPPPGIQKMFRGVDITELDLLPLQSLGNDGFNSPIVKFTCDKGKTWKSPNGKVYELPDQIWQVTSLPGGWMSAETELYKSSNQLKESFGVEVGVEANVKKFAFSASVSYTSMQNTITNTSKFISDVGAFIAANTVEMEPNKVLPLDDHAKASVDNDLRGTYETNPKTYNDFINTYGTHFFYRANFGGYIRAIYRTESNYFFSHSENSVKANAQASYMSAISVSAGVSKGTEKIDETFTQSTSQSIRYYGGNTNLLAKGNGLAEWQPTVANDPWLFSGKLKPISDLFTDTAKKSSMEKAVEQYLLRSYVGELERLISYAKSKSGDAVLNSLQTRVQSFKNAKLLASNDVDALSVEIDNQIKLPNWFTTSTKLCFKWWANWDSSQCGYSGLPSDLCASPNSMTQFYKDDTDIRIGGCKMQWGITSSGYPDWFNQVQVCFQFWPDGDKCQCGDKGTGPVMCASINKFTEPYLDDTDARVGGCMMSWRLTVPSTAPLWMRTAKMCYSWEPTVQGDECGGAATKDMCLTANEWTPAYRDNTHDFGGGCKMSWGIKTVFV